MSRDTTGRSERPAGADPVAAELAAAVARLADRLRSLSDVRLARPLPPARSRADAAHALAQRMADHAAALEGAPSRPVPRLHDLAVGDQVAVTGTDLVRALGSSGAHGGASEDRAAEDRDARAHDALAAVRALRDAL